MFSTINTRFGIRTLFLSIACLLLVGCGGSTVTYEVKDEAAQKQMKAKAAEGYLKNATPEQKEAIMKHQSKAQE